MRKRLLGMILAVLVAASPATLPAQTHPDARDDQDSVSQVRWKDEWHKIRPWQYPTAISLLGFGFSSRYLLPDPNPDGEGTVEFEQDIVDAIAVRQDPARANVAAITDMGFYGAMAFRAVDSGLLPGLLHDNWEVAWQMSWIDLQAFGVVAAGVWGSQIFIGRVRPAANNCDDPTRAGNICDTNNKDYARSFIAGHPATAIAAAGVTCLHHEHMPLYGGGFASPWRSRTPQRRSLRSHRPSWKSNLG